MNTRRTALVWWANAALATRLAMGWLAMGCASESGQPGASGLAGGIAGAPRPATAGEWLAGDGKSCMTRAECSTSACYLGRCSGLLTSGALWAQDLVLEIALESLKPGDPAHQRVMQAVAAAASDPTATESERARALRAWIVLDPDGAEPAAEEATQQGGVAGLLADLARAPLGHAAAQRRLVEGWPARSETGKALTAAALASQPSPESIALLSTASKSQDESLAVRLAAARALAQASPNAALPSDPSAPFLDWPLLHARSHEAAPPE